MRSEVDGVALERAATGMNAKLILMQRKICDGYYRSHQSGEQVGRQHGERTKVGRLMSEYIVD